MSSWKFPQPTIRTFFVPSRSIVNTFFLGMILCDGALPLSSSPTAGPHHVHRETAFDSELPISTPLGASRGEERGFLNIFDTHNNCSSIFHDRGEGHWRSIHIKIVAFIALKKIGLAVDDRTPSWPRHLRALHGTSVAKCHMCCCKWPELASEGHLFDGSPPAVDVTLKPLVLAHSLTFTPLISEVESREVC